MQYLGYRPSNQRHADITEVADLVANTFLADSPDHTIRASSPAMTMNSGVLFANSPTSRQRQNVRVVVPPRLPSPPLVTIEPLGPRKERSHRSDDFTARAKRTSTASESSGSQRSSQSLSRNNRRLMIYNPDDADGTSRRRKDKLPEKSQPALFKYEPPPLPPIETAPYSNTLVPLAPNRYVDPPLDNAGSKNKATMPSQNFLSAPSSSSRIFPSGKRFTNGNDYDTFSDTDSLFSTTSSTWKKPPADMAISRKKSSGQEQVRASRQPQPLRVIPPTRFSQGSFGDTRPGVKEVLTHFENFFPSHNLNAVVENSMDEDTDQGSSKPDASRHKYIMKSVKTIAEEQIGSPIRRRQTRLWDSHPEEIKAPR